MTGRRLWTMIWRYGSRVGLIGVAVTGVDFAFQVWRRVMGWPLGQFVILYQANIALVGLLSAVAGFLLARRIGHRGAGSWAGAIAAIIPVLVAGLVMTSLLIWQQGTLLLPLNLLEGLLALIAAGIVLGGMLGLVLGVGGAQGGYLLWRRQDPAYLARRAQLRAMTFKERRNRWLKDNVVPLLVAFLLIAALAGVVGLPLYLGYQFSSWWPDQTLLLGVGFLAVTLALILVFRHQVKARLVSNWLACVCASLAFWLLFAGTALDGFASFVTAMAMPGLYMYTFYADVSRIMFPQHTTTEASGDPENLVQGPVVFHDDGTSLVFYPNRRILALHAGYAGVVSTGLLVPVWLFPAMPPLVRWGLAVFGVMVILFGVLPDLIRLLVRWPTLRVTAAGIVDASSMHLFGFGLIPWEQFVAALPVERALHHGRFAELLIMVQQLPQLVAAQPWWKRHLLKLVVMGRLGLFIPISGLLLAQSPQQVTEQIVVYIKSHAPPDYVDSIFGDEE